MDDFFALPRYPFLRAALEYAPEEPGIYALFDGDELVYVGRAGDRGDHSIKACLLRHQDGRHGECTMKAKTYTWEITLWASARETEILAAFYRRHRRDPRCQSKVA
jgi:hypothetical protein